MSMLGKSRITDTISGCSFELRSKINQGPSADCAWQTGTQAENSKALNQGIMQRGIGNFMAPNDVVEKVSSLAHRPANQMEYQGCL